MPDPANHVHGDHSLSSAAQKSSRLSCSPGSVLGRHYPQKWLSFRSAPTSLHQEAPQIALQADFVVIDGPPRVAALARSALLAADLVLIPVQPSAYDVWASHEMVQLITEARVFRPQLRAAFVINRRVVGTVIGREARAALADQPFPALVVEVSQRIVFADSVAAGRLAFEVAPNCAAAREIAALTQAVREVLG
ncbi:hypothetical protein CBP34_05010 [Acidovorax carolinensis]|uniref:AAA domain-containing protein n=1 Tax=Acidovorax carolinensis TaxID=553814 RepID=A0A240U7Y5_9BURK|nr:hypothetical protein CBP34_05010 [Acidovorax carolinensis]